MLLFPMGLLCIHDVNSIIHFPYCEQLDMKIRNICIQMHVKTSVVTYKTVYTQYFGVFFSSNVAVYAPFNPVEIATLLQHLRGVDSTGNIILKSNLVNNRLFD